MNNDATDTSPTRKDVEKLCNESRYTDARNALMKIWNSRPTQRNAAFVSSHADMLNAANKSVSHKIAILRSFTTETVTPLLHAGALLRGINLEITETDFNTYAQEILSPQSSLYTFKPDSVILAVLTRDCAPELWDGFSILSPQEVEEVVDRVGDSFEVWLKTFREHSDAAMIVHNLEMPPFSNAGLADARFAVGQKTAIERINNRIRTLCSQIAHTYYLDYEELVATHGRLNWNDESRWLTARLPIRGTYLSYLADQWLRYLIPLCGQSKKVLVVDLDNTLWGGVIGEDGLAGIQIGHEYPGAAYLALQKVIKDLQHRGVILAVCSKNNVEDAMEAIERHPAMLLRKDDFGALRINWELKSENIVSIAEELNVGIDSVVFLDDNPMERAEVGARLPEVTVLDVPCDPMEYAGILQRCMWFESLSFSSEDTQRSAMYTQERKRREHQKCSGSLEEYLLSLGIQAEINELSPMDLTRTTQLTQKTNQFNMTTLRCTETDVGNYSDSADKAVLVLHTKDRFGDNGQVGVALLSFSEQQCVLDNFLLSCRVLGRSIETAFLSAIIEYVKTKGAKKLRGVFIPSAKNAPASDFYERHGFVCTSKDDECIHWSLEVQEKGVDIPQWIAVEAAP